MALIQRRASHGECPKTSYRTVFDALKNAFSRGRKAVLNGCARHPGELLAAFVLDFFSLLFKKWRRDVEGNLKRRKISGCRRERKPVWTRQKILRARMTAVALMSPPANGRREKLTERRVSREEAQRRPEHILKTDVCRTAP